MVIWKIISGFDDMYSISNTGEIRNNRTGKTLKQTVNKQGYPSVSVRPYGRLGVCKCFKVHREVATAFVSNPDGLKEVNHEDGIKTNNNDWNLEWCTRKHNMVHASNLGLLCLGDRNHASKLTEEQVREIRTDKTTPVKEFVAKFDVNKTTIGKVRNKKSWIHVEV